MSAHGQRWASTIAMEQGVRAVLSKGPATPDQVASALGVKRAKLDRLLTLMRGVDIKVAAFRQPGPRGGRPAQILALADVRSYLTPSGGLKS